jgi:hypothetical protein
MNLQQPRQSDISFATSSDPSRQSTGKVVRRSLRSRSRDGRSSSAKVLRAQAENPTWIPDRLTHIIFAGNGSRRNPRIWPHHFPHISTCHHYTMRLMDSVPPSIDTGSRWRVICLSIFDEVLSLMLPQSIRRTCKKYSWSQLRARSRKVPLRPHYMQRSSARRPTRAAF